MSALEQLRFDMGSVVPMPPEYRLMMAFVATAGRTHTVNPFMKKRNEIVVQAGAATVSATKEAEATKEEQVGEDK